MTSKFNGGVVQNKSYGGGSIVDTPTSYNHIQNHPSQTTTDTLQENSPLITKAITKIF